MAIASRCGVFALSSLIFVSFSALSISAQQPEAKAEAGRKVTVDVVVSPRSGPPVAGLPQETFQILDNKVPQTMTSFVELGGEKAPVEVLLVIDAVNATFSTVATERDQIQNFLRSHGGHLASPTSLAVVTDTGTQIQPSPSKDGNALSAALDQYTNRLRTIRRSSGFYGADERMNLSINAMHQLVAREGTKKGRKLILWVSPGWPLLSGPNVLLDAKQEQQIFSTVVQLSTELRQEQVTLYALDPLGANESLSRNLYYEAFLKGLSKPRDANLGNLALQVLAVQSGGLAVNSNDLAALLEHSVEDATAYYEISYKPAPAERRDEYHSVEVRVTKPGLSARTIQGYYSQP